MRCSVGGFHGSGVSFHLRRLHFSLSNAIFISCFSSIAFHTLAALSAASVFSVEEDSIFSRGGVHGGQCRRRIPLGLGLLVANGAPDGGVGEIDMPIFPDAALIESEAVGVPFFATLYFLKTVHEEENFVLVLALVHLEGADYLTMHDYINKIFYDAL
jgi:hypothetical protein